MFIDVNRPWRKVKATEHRATTDFAECMRELVDVHRPKADRIRVVLDNLSTHTAGALYQAFPADQARRLLRRLALHHTPKHAGWLNMVEIEIRIFSTGSCPTLTAQSPAPFAIAAVNERSRIAAASRRSLIRPLRV